MSKIYPPKPSIGLVIGAYASVPYIHLHMESWKRHYPSIPVLVHDDCSVQAVELEKLCRDYGADFISPPHSLGHQAGDLSAYYRGLMWAHERGLDVLVKMSQRFLPLVDWTSDLQQLAYDTQRPTYTNLCGGHHFPFRSECAALHTFSWIKVLDRVKAAVEAHDFGIVENFLNHLACEVQRQNKTPSLLEGTDLQENEQPLEIEGDCYGAWPFPGDNGKVQRDGHLWHRAHEAAHYYRLARQYGLQQYAPENFTDTLPVKYLPKPMISAFDASTTLPGHLSLERVIPMLIDDLFEVAAASPSDINEHLKLLAHLTSLCEHVTEFSSRTGRSTTALLYGRPQTVRSYDTNFEGQSQDLVKAAEEAGVDFSLIKADVLNIRPLA